MRGVNSLKMNQATMVEAVNEYLSSRYSRPIKVTKVAAEDARGYSADEFQVTIEEREWEPGSFDPPSPGAAKT